MTHPCSPYPRGWKVTGKASGAPHRFPFYEHRTQAEVREDENRLLILRALGRDPVRRKRA